MWTMDWILLIVLVFSGIKCEGCCWGAFRHTFWHSVKSSFISQVFLWHVMDFINTTFSRTWNFSSRRKSLAGIENPFQNIVLVMVVWKARSDWIHENRNGNQRVMMLSCRFWSNYDGFCCRGWCLLHSKSLHLAANWKSATKSILLTCKANDTLCWLHQSCCTSGASVVCNVCSVVKSGEHFKSENVLFVGKGLLDTAAQKASSHEDETGVMSQGMLYQSSS